MFRKDRMGRRGGGVLLYIKDTIPAYEVQLPEEADCNEAVWCKLVTGHTTVIIGVVYRCPNITKQNNEKIHNAIISEVSKGDCSGWLLLVRTLSTLRAPLYTLGWCLLLHNRCQTLV